MKRLAMYAVLMTSLLAGHLVFASEWGPRGLGCDVQLQNFASPNLQAVVTANQTAICEPVAKQAEERLSNGQGFNFDKGPQFYGNSVEIAEVHRAYIPSINTIGYETKAFVAFGNIDKAGYFYSVFTPDFKYLGPASDVSSKTILAWDSSKMSCSLNKEITIGSGKADIFVIDAGSFPSSVRNLTFKSSSGQVLGVASCKSLPQDPSLDCRLGNTSVTVDLSETRTDAGAVIGDIIGGFVTGNSNSQSNYFSASVTQGDFLPGIFGVKTEAQCVPEQ